MTGENIIAAVDIGTAKTTVFVGEICGSSLNLIGYGQYPTTGMAKGELFDVRAVESSVQTAFHAAEKSAGLVSRVNRADMSVTGRLLGARRLTGSAGVAGAHVSTNDMKRARADALVRTVSPDRVTVSLLPQPYFVDDRMAAHPEGMSGHRLEANFWRVDADIDRLRELLYIPANMGVKVDGLIPSSIASGRAVTTEEERKRGCLVIDVGEGTTDFVVYRHGCVVHTGSLPIGGAHLTNDLALGLRLTRAQADTVKRTFARAHTAPDDEHASTYFGDSTGLHSSRLLYHRSINLIAEARLDELFGLIKKQIEPFCSPGKLPSGCRLTGGVSRLPGIDQLAANVLRLETLLGVANEWVVDEFKGPEHSTGLGLLEHSFYAELERRNNLRPRSGLLHRVKSLLAA